MPKNYNFRLQTINRFLLDKQIGLCFSTMSNDSKNSLIIDYGSCTTKAGYSNRDFPRTKVPSFYGIPKYEKSIGLSLGGGTGEYVGYKTESHNPYLILKDIIKNGEIQSYDHFASLSEQIFNTESYNQNPCLIVEPTNSSKEQKEKKTQILIETFEIPSFILADSTRLTHLFSGVSTGLMINIGDTTTSLYGIKEGKPIKKTIQKINFGGRDSTNFLKKILTEKNIHLTNSSDYYILENIKKQIGYLSLDFEKEMNNEIEKNFELPDGSIISLGNHKFRCNEVLFNPMLVYKEIPGIHELISDTLKENSDLIDCYFSGGCSLTKGLPERLEIEMKKIGNLKSKFHFTDGREFGSFCGAAIFSELDGYKDFWIQKDEYEENGPSIVHYENKCFL